MEAKKMSETELAPIIPMRPSNRDLRLHALSLQIAAIYREFDLLNDGKEACDDILHAYLNIRRHIGKDANGDRWGSKSAYQAMKGLL